MQLIANIVIRHRLYKHVYLSRRHFNSNASSNRMCWTCKYKGLLHRKQMRDAHHVQNVSRFCISFVNVAASLWLASELLSVIFLNYLPRGSRPQSHFENRISLRDGTFREHSITERLKIAGIPFICRFFGQFRPGLFEFHETFFKWMPSIRILHAILRCFLKFNFNLI